MMKSYFRVFLLLTVGLAACGGSGGATTDTGQAGNGAANTSGSCAAPEGQSVTDSVTFAPGVTVTTIAGGAMAGDDDGPAGTATLANPVSVVIEPGGSLIVADFDNDQLRRIDTAGNVTTIVRQPDFQRPYGMAFGSDGVLYVDTDFNQAGDKSNTTGTIWRIDGNAHTATVVAANIGRTRGVAGVPNAHQLVLADYQNARVLTLDLSTAMTAELTPADCLDGAGGPGTEPPFAVPYGVVALGDGRVVVADQASHNLRAISADGTVALYAGGADTGTVDGTIDVARFVKPTAVAIDASGSIYVSDVGAHRIRRISTDGTVVTIAGDGTAGFKDGAGAQARFFGQEGLAVSADGRTLYVADGTGGEEGTPYNRIRKITISP